MAGSESIIPSTSVDSGPARATSSALSSARDVERVMLMRLSRADETRGRVLVERQRMREAHRVASTYMSHENEVKRSFGAAYERLSQLQSGRGAQIFNIAAARLYEFWIEVPGYAGPVRGTMARVTQSGGIQHVSDVKGKTSGGLGGAAVGGLLLGPLGAVVGAVATRKTEVKTDVREVDTRKFELEIVGPGFAWSTMGGPSSEISFRRFRDLVNARGSSSDDVGVLRDAQAVEVETVRGNLQQAAEVRLSAASAVTKCVRSYDDVWDQYTAERLPVARDLKARWARLNPGRRKLLVATMMIAFLVWAACTVIGFVTENNVSVALGDALGVLALGASCGALALYFYRVRLFK